MPISGGNTGWPHALLPLVPPMPESVRAPFVNILQSSHPGAREPFFNRGIKVKKILSFIT